MLNRVRRHWLLAVALLVPFGVAAGGRVAQRPEAFDTLKPQPDIIYLLANSSVILGPDLKSAAEDLTFTGTVVVPKFPGDGFSRRKLPNGRYQIDFELTSSELRGESYLMQGPVILGEHPDLRSLGTITQREPGKDYPADFIVQRKVLIETPNGLMYNEDPVPVRGTIDAIPPVRSVLRPNGLSQINVFRGEDLPVRMLGEKGDTAGWFYSRVHVAFAVEPIAIYRFNAVADLRVAAGGKDEQVRLSGPVEMVERRGFEGSPEIVMTALRGESRVLGGQVMLIEAFDALEKVSAGPLGARSSLRLFAQIKSPSGILDLEAPLQLEGVLQRAQETDRVSLGQAGTVPVYHMRLDQQTAMQLPIFNDAGREVARLSGFHLVATEPTGRRPCCPRVRGGR